MSVPEETKLTLWLPLLLMMFRFWYWP